MSGEMGCKFRLVIMSRETKRVLLIFIVFLFGPWGLFLLLAPLPLLNMTGEWWGWRRLGGMSMIGGLVYCYAYWKPETKWAKIIAKFGVLDNFIPGLIFIVWGIWGKMPWVFWTQIPLLGWLGWRLNREVKLVKVGEIG
jgi:hypothetical protein